jgi:hypothetical protein
MAAGHALLCSCWPGDSCAHLLRKLTTYMYSFLLADLALLNFGSDSCQQLDEKHMGVLSTA